MTCRGGNRVNGFTVASGLSRTLAGRLVKVADRVRDLATRFGLRPYRVYIVRTRWTAGERGAGAEYVTQELELQPTPRVASLDSLAEVIQPVGIVEEGTLRVDEISGRYQEEHLRGYGSDGAPPEPDEQVFWEVEWVRQDGQPGERLRFTVRGKPAYEPGRLAWSVTLTRAQQARGRQGELR